MPCAAEEVIGQILGLKASRPAGASVPDHAPFASDLGFSVGVVK